MLSYHSGQGGLPTAWGSCQQNQLLVGELLWDVAIWFGVWHPFAEDADIAYVGVELFGLTFEDNLIPGFKPSDHVSVMQLVSQKIEKPFGLIFAYPRRIMNKLIL